MKNPNRTNSPATPLRWDHEHTTGVRSRSEFAQSPIAIARSLYAHDPIGVELQESLYALDSTTIDLCISLFPCAKVRQHKAAVKVHTLLDLPGNIPSFMGPATTP